MKYVLGLISILLLVIIIGAASFYFGTQSANNKAVMMTSPTPTVFVTAQSPTPTGTATTNTNVKTVQAGGVLVFSAYSLNTPDGWASQHQQGENMDTLTLTKGVYKIVFSQVAGGGGGCVYPGDPPAQFAQSFSSFVEITNPNGFVFRRGPVDSNNWTVCQKNTSDGSFGFPTNFGNVSITTPASVDSKIMSETDSILASIKKQ